ncbi:MAG: hypothetical protein IPM79_30940 [Polyangiaceae bacterium]|nr:hypothetical protein [Polyangiaceae bacterium]
MKIPRVQAFELNDHPAVPAVLRDVIIEALSRTLVWGKILDGLVEPLEAFLEAAGTSAVLDLGSGGGGPAEILVAALERRGRQVRWTLTDLFPRSQAWSTLRERHPRSIDFVAQSTDATRIPEDLSNGRARTIINVLHHLPPPLARGVLRDAVDNRAPIFVAEGFERSPGRFAAFAPAGLLALASSPLYARDQRLARALITWATPIGLLSSIWDGVISTLRVYSEEELRDMVADAPGYDWTYGNYRFAPFGKGYYFHGVPRR